MASANPMEQETIFSMEEFNHYFLVNLEYDVNGWKWVKETILHFTLTADRKTSEGSVAIEHLNKHLSKTLNDVNYIPTTVCLQGKLKNIFGSTHAEIELLRQLESGFFDYKARKDQKDQENTMNLKQQDLTEKISRMSIKDTDERIEEKMSLSLKLLLNYSPCSKCAHNITDFQDKMKLFNIDISAEKRFGTFYKFKKAENKKGLAVLKRKNISLYQIWDYEPLQIQIQQIGNEKERMKRRNQDQEYMTIVDNLAAQ